MRKKRIRSRVYMVTQYEVNPATGEDLGFDEQTIIDGILSRARGLARWAYVRHDKDKYLEGDDIPEGKVVGDERPAHWHVILQFNNQAELDGVASAFGVLPQYVDKMSGSGAFFDGVYYLTHEDPKQQALGKTVYSRDEVYLPENQVTEIWETVDNRQLMRAKNLPASVELENYIVKLTKGQITLKQIYRENSILYTKNHQMLKTARSSYLKHSEPPVSRVNYYLQGEAGAGKTVAAKALARSLYPGMADDEIFFVVGDGNVPFDGYDGQPVIIWDDWRAKDILKKFDRGMVWKIFAVNPDRVTINVKYGQTSLINAVSIITSVTPFKEFVNDLTGDFKDSKGVIHKAEDKNQAYRRFPVFIEVSRESYELYVSMALNGKEYSEYQMLARVTGSFVKLAQNPTPENTTKLLGPVKKVHEKHSVTKKQEYEDIEVETFYNQELITLFDD